MNYIKKPNLPEREVKLAIIDSKAHDEASALISLGITLIKSVKRNFIDENISTHPDMQICHLGDEKFIVTEDTTNYYKNELEDLGDKLDCDFFNKEAELITVTENITGEIRYPNDCKLNAVITNNFVITHIKNSLFDNLDKKTIKVRQGYTKCSTCIVSDNAIITADKSIATSAESNGIDVCIVTNDTIELKGYSNGFIGGCSGKISKDTIAFFGDLKTHPDHDKIISFCKNHRVHCISLTKNNLKDFGSLLPIIED